MGAKCSSNSREDDFMRLKSAYYSNSHSIKTSNSHHLRSRTPQLRVQNSRVRKLTPELSQKISSLRESHSQTIDRKNFTSFNTQNLLNDKEDNNSSNESHFEDPYKVLDYVNNKFDHVCPAPEHFATPVLFDHSPNLIDLEVPKVNVSEENVA